MDWIKMLQKEFEYESQTTRKMLACIPDGKYDWKPHEKSMSVRQLSGHIAELPSWIAMVVTTDELDFATSPYESPKIDTTADLLASFEKHLIEGRKHLEMLNENILDQTWILRNGDQIYQKETKAVVIRQTYCQIVHHRAQLGVFLRLLNVAIPGSYGPSADESF
ncbi:MAG: DinB family protein [Bacteroidota bacterium]